MMRRYLLIVVLVISLGAVCGCQSLHVGGSGNVGGVHAGGGVSIPVPR